MICFFCSARASPSLSSANLLTTCFSVLLKSNGSHHGKATICPKKFFPFPEIRGIIRVPYASFLIPAKNFAVFWVKFAITIYPRKGTETLSGLLQQAHNVITIYPRKGTETTLKVLCPSSMYRLQFIPVRGRERAIVFKVHSELITIYPRKGTETVTSPDEIARSIKLQFIPARGRKLQKLAVKSDALHITIYPRKGTETGSWHCGTRTSSVLQFIPARGQKSTSATGVCQQRRCFAFSYILFYRLGAVPAGIVFVTGSALTPCGTSGFMGRISCR